MKSRITQFPVQIVKRMIHHQVDQGNAPDLNVFKKSICSGRSSGGFNWYDTEEGVDFWMNVIALEYFDLFFTRYPLTEKEND